MHTIIQKVAMLANLHIEDNGVPIYVQIRDQFLAAIGSGILQPGERLPTMREVAVALKVDLNTARHAYDELEQTGAIVIVRARGTYVAERPPSVDAERQAKRIDALARQLIALSAAAGIDAVDVAQQVIKIYKRRGGKT
jgi:GntR family transcriptional regulator